MTSKIKLILATMFLGFLFVPVSSVSAATCFLDSNIFPCPSGVTEDTCYSSTTLNSVGYEETTCPSTFSCLLDGNLYPCPASVTRDTCYLSTTLNSTGIEETTCPVNSEDEDEAILTSCDAEVLNRENCKIVDYAVTGINLLSALAAMAIVGSVIMAGFQYMTARDNAGQIQAARTRIIWALVALFVFIFMYAFLNWVVPGGVL